MEPTNEIRVADNGVQLSLWVNDQRVVDHFASVPSDDLSAEARRVIRLGVDTATQVGVRAETLALDEARRRITDETEAVQARLSELAVSMDKAWRSEIQTLRAGTVTELQEAVRAATGDDRLAGIVGETLSAAGSPLRVVERRLTDAAKAMEQAHEQALNRAIGQLGEVATSLARLTGTLEANQKSPARGVVYEDSLENRLTAVVDGRGDRLADVRTKPGEDGSKRGDYVARLDGSAVHVGIELKNTSRGPSAEAARELVDQICTARGAQAALLVAATPDAMPAGLRGTPLGLIGSRGVAVCVSPGEDEGLLTSAYAISRAIAILEDRRNNVEAVGDLDKALHAASEIRKRIRVMADSELRLKGISKDISAESKRVRNLTQEALRQLESIADEIAKFNKAAA